MHRHHNLSDKTQCLHFLLAAEHTARLNRGDGWRDGKTGTELPGRVHSAAPPGNKTSSDNCAIIHSVGRGEKRGVGGGQMTRTQSKRNEGMNEGMNE